MSTQPERKFTKPAHTPGPWVVDLDREFIQDGDQVSVEALTPDGMVAREVCSLFLDTGENKDGESYEEDAANARLIATAPDYHEAACKHLARHDDEAESMGVGQCGCETCESFRPLVAKAEGR